MGACDQHHKKVAKTFRFEWIAVIDTSASVDNEDLVSTVNGQANVFKSSPSSF